MAGNLNLPTENIKEVVLRLLDLDPVEISELDIDTYRSYIKELLIEVTMGSRKLDPEEVEILKNELKRTREEKQKQQENFEIKNKKTKITSDKLGLGNIVNTLKNNLDLEADLSKSVNLSQKALPYTSILKPADNEETINSESSEIKTTTAKVGKIEEELQNTKNIIEAIKKIVFSDSFLKPTQKLLSPGIGPSATNNTDSNETEVVKDEFIDERILKILKIEKDTKINYQTYFEKIKNKLASHRLVGKELPIEEQTLLEEELKRVWRIKDRGATNFKAKTKPIIKNKQGAIVKTTRGEISKNQPESQKNNIAKIIKNEDDPLDRIIKRLDSIIDILTNLNKETVLESERQRRGSEFERRRKREESLESKIFSGITSLIGKALSPFKSIWDYITNFLWNIFLGKIVIKLLQWFGDPKNKDKVASIIRFFKDWWPTMLAAYILFGTSFGKLARTVVGLAINGTVKLAKGIARLIAAIAKGKALRAADSDGPDTRRRGRRGSRGIGGLVKGGLRTAGNLVAGYAIGKGIEYLAGGDKQEEVSQNPTEQQQTKINVPDAPKIPFLSAASGGLASINKIFETIGQKDKSDLLSSLLGPIAMLMNVGKNVIPQEFQGKVSGPKGRDKVPAMLTDGEFVMSTGAVKKYGVETLEAMNAAGGGTNVPKVIEGKVHAAGGGFIGDASAAQSAWSDWMKVNPEKFSKAGTYGPQDAYNKAAREFMKTFIKTGKPPEWAVSDSKKIDVNATEPTSTRRNRTAAEPDSYNRRTPNSSAESTKTSSSWWKKWTSQYQSARTQAPPPPRPTSSAIVPSNNTLGSRVNVNAPKARIGTAGPLTALLSALDFINRKSEGQTTAQAALGTGGSALGGTLGWMGGAQTGSMAGAAIGAGFGGVGAVPGALIGAGIGGVSGSFGGSALGGKIADDISGVNADKERRNRGGIGGRIVGGWRLKQQQYREMPKTQVMTDSKGRPFVGYKALRGGKPVYVRGPRAGTGTSNPLEMLGRMINPNAYRSNDARLGMKKHKEAMVNSLESFQAQGMSTNAQRRMIKQMGGNLKDVQNDLNYRKKTKDAPKPKRIGRGGTSPIEFNRQQTSSVPMSLSRQQPRRNAVKPPSKRQPQITGRGGSGRSKPKGRPPRSGNTLPAKVPSVAATRPRNTAPQRRQLGIFV